MRWQSLFENLLDYDFSKAEEIANTTIINGGWEVWFQVEFAYHMKQKNASFQLKREEIYPGGVITRCDFLIWYGTPNRTTFHDPTYIELKCINQLAANPKQDAIRRYISDLTKNIPPNNIVGCMLLFYGNDQDILNMPAALHLPAADIRVLRYNAGKIDYASDINTLLYQFGYIPNDGLYLLYYERTT